MMFSEWLRKMLASNPSEDMDLVGPTILNHPKVWDALNPSDDVRSVARRCLSADDEVADAFARVFGAYVASLGPASAPTRNPMGEPYAPGARTTLADARLKLVCAALSTMDRDVPEEAARLSVETADTALKEMGCRHG